MRPQDLSSKGMDVKKEKFIPYGMHWLGEDDIEEAVKILKSNWLARGPKTEEFERALAKYCGSRYGVVLSSGTAALHLAYIAAGVGPGDEVITSPLTFAATSNAVCLCGAKPVFADIDPNTLNISPKETGAKITKKTKAIAPVDFAGLPCEFDEITSIARRRNLLVIEDAAHALGAEYKGKRVGGLSDMTVLSFHPVKHICTGEGGAVLTSNKKFYEAVKRLRHHGIARKPEKGGWYYEVVRPGYNYWITDFQSAMGLSQLKKLPGFLKRRREIARQYTKAFADLEEIITPKEPKGLRSAWHIYPVQFRLERLKAGRKEIFDQFRKQGIMAQVHYMPLHLHPFYKKQFGYKAGDFPVAEAYYSQAVTLPLFPKMTKSQVERVMKVTKEIIKKYKK